MDSSPPNQGNSNPQERDLVNPLFHQQYAQQTRRVQQPARSFVAGPGYSNVFAPVLPPNLTAMPQLPQQQFPGQQISPPQRMFGPPQSHLPEEQALRQIISARAIQTQQQHHQHQHHSNPISQQQHLQFLPHYSESNNLYGFQLPHSGLRVAIPACPPAYLGLQQASPSPSHNPQNGASNPAAHLSQYALRTYRDMHEQSPADFVHGIRRPHSTSNPQIFHPQPHHPASFAPQHPSGIFPPLSSPEMAGSRRKKPPRGKNATPSSTRNTKGGTSSQGVVDGIPSQSMTPNNLKDGSKAEHSPEINASPLARAHQQLGMLSDSGPSNRRRDQVVMSGNSMSNGASQTLQPTAAKSPQDETMTRTNEDSGYTSRHESLGKDLPAREATAEMLDAATASLEQQIQSSILLPFVEPPAGKFSEYKISHSVPFMKVTKSFDFEVADNVSSLGGDPPFSEGEDQSGRPSYVSHPYNRYITWQKYSEYTLDFMDPYLPYVQFPNMFIDQLDTLNDIETLKQLPNAGYKLQYLSEPPQLPDTRIWVVQVTWLPKNGDLWLPVPLLGLFNKFDDTPYGIAIEYPESVNVVIRPNRHAEFTESEAATLMEISMERLRTSFLEQPQKLWNVYTAQFMGAHGWTPAVERMRVLDLMFQVDLIYYWQACGAPMHPFSMYNQNTVRILEGHPPIARYD